MAEKWSGQNRTCRTGSAAPENTNVWVLCKHKKLYMCDVMGHCDCLSLPTCTLGHSEFTSVESSACVGCSHLFNLWTWLYITPLPLQIRQSCHYDDPRVNKLHNSDNTLKQYHQYYYCFDHQNITTVFWSSQLWLSCKKQIDKYVLPSMNTMKRHQLTQ